MRTLTLVAIPLCLCLASAAGADTPGAAQRSTGNAETRVAAPAPAPAAATPAPAAAPALPIDVRPQAPVRVAFTGTETRRLVEGKASASSPAVVLWSAPTGKMLNVQLMLQGNAGAVVIYQPGAQEPDAGTALRDGAIRWIGECSKGGELRLEVHPKSAVEVAFKLGLEVVPEGLPKP